MKASSIEEIIRDEVNTRFGKDPLLVHVDSMHRVGDTVLFNVHAHIDKYSYRQYDLMVTLSDVTK